MSDYVRPHGDLASSAGDGSVRHLDGAPRREARERFVREEQLTLPGDARAIVLFDGVCNLCNGIVRFIAANDPAGHFAFLSLQSPRAAQLLTATGGPPRDDSVILLEYGRRFESSDAALYIALGLRAPWPALFALIALPRGLRDLVYGWIARNRYRWFGRRDVCMVPTPELQERFLDERAVP